MTIHALPGRSNLLDFADQGLFLALRATGTESVVQMVWIYEHPIDVERLRRFHLNLGHGLLGRRIERSPLPFGRHRWVSALGPSSPLDVDDAGRPREQLGDWVDERSQVPADPEFGPGWHLGAAIFDDGSTGVSLVASHCLVDGMGLIQTVVEAITDHPRDLGLPLPNSRPKIRRVLSDLGETVRDFPQAIQALVRGVRLAVRNRRHERPANRLETSASDVTQAADEVLSPNLVAFVDIPTWDTRAQELGGNSHSLVAGFAARLGERMARVRSEDGLVKLLIPVNERAAGDIRANAVTLGYANLDPRPVTSSLAEARAVIREVLREARDEPNESFQTLPLIPFVPKRALSAGADAFFGFAGELPVSASNLGDIEQTALCPDGTAAEYAFIRGVDGRITRAELEQRRGFLTVICARMGGKVTLPIIAYQPGGKLSTSGLRTLVSETLAEFGLPAVFE